MCIIGSNECWSEMSVGKKRESTLLTKNQAIIAQGVLLNNFSKGDCACSGRRFWMKINFVENVHKKEAFLRKSHTSASQFSCRELTANVSTPLCFKPIA